MRGLKPITLLPARERVASALRKAIISRQIPEGEVLALDATAQALGVSVTPVREAFQILARDGLIELRQNKGAVVLGINEDTIRQHYEMRAALESAAVAMFMEKGADIVNVENCVMQAREALDAGDSSNYGNLNQSFHMEIWIGADNEKMKHALAELWNGLSMGVKTTEDEYAHKSQEEHEAIFAAMKAGEEAKACALMRRHILRSMEDMLTRYC